MSKKDRMAGISPDVIGIDEIGHFDRVRGLNYDMVYIDDMQATDDPFVFLAGRAVGKSVRGINFEHGNIAPHPAEELKLDWDKLSPVTAAAGRVLFESTPPEKPNPFSGTVRMSQILINEKDWHDILEFTDAPKNTTPGPGAPPPRRRKK